MPVSVEKSFIYIKIVLSAALLAFSGVLTVQMIHSAKQAQDMRMDLAELNHVRYGLLNADQWKEQVTFIISKRIIEFDLTPENRGELQKSLEVIMYNLLDDLELVLEERTKGEFSGMKKFIASMVIDVNQLRDSVPSYAGKVLDEINKPATKRSVQTYLNDKLEDLGDATYNMDSTRMLESVLLKYGSPTLSGCREQLQSDSGQLEEQVNFRVMMIILAVVLIFLLNCIQKGPFHPLQGPMLILASFCLLAGGIITPMIDLEARIDLLQFQLIGELVEFRDNIIFFQSKSITDIVEILIRDGALEMIFVGILIFTFSIIFPISKLISSWIWSRGKEEVNKNKLLRFFVIKSGKWSMADVMVVAIFMAYIGFNGVVGSQLDSLRDSTQSVEIFTTNGTRLLGGFYLFLSFCIASLVLSEVLVRKTRSS